MAHKLTGGQRFGGLAEVSFLTSLGWVGFFSSKMGPTVYLLKTNQALYCEFIYVKNFNLIVSYFHFLCEMYAKMPNRLDYSNRRDDRMR